MIKALSIVFYFMNIVFLVLQSVMLQSVWVIHVATVFTVLSAIVYLKNSVFHVIGLTLQFVSIVFNLLIGLDVFNMVVIVVQTFLLKLYMVMLFKRNDEKVVALNII